MGFQSVRGIKHENHSLSIMAKPLPAPEKFQDENQRRWGMLYLPCADGSARNIVSLPKKCRFLWRASRKGEEKKGTV